VIENISVSVPFVEVVTISLVESVARTQVMAVMDAVFVGRFQQKSGSGTKIPGTIDIIVGTRRNKNCRQYPKGRFHK
jgi:hypothetical protein